MKSSRTYHRFKGLVLPFGSVSASYCLHASLISDLCIASRIRKVSIWHPHTAFSSMIHMFLCVSTLLDFDCSFHFPFSGIGVGRASGVILHPYLCDLFVTFFFHTSAFLFAFLLLFFPNVFRSSWLDSSNTFRALWPVTSAFVFSGPRSTCVPVLCRLIGFSLGGCSLIYLHTWTCGRIVLPWMFLCESN